MPNYSLVIGSKFRPLSYQEMLAPVLQQTQAHQEIEQMYATLNAQADQWKNIALEEPDSKTAARYLKYSDDLKANAAALAMSGLNANSRQSMYDLNARYQSEIMPIETAYKRKMAEAADQLKGGNNMRYSYNAADRSLDDYIDNPSETYKAFDLKLPYDDAINEMGQLSKVLMDIKHGTLDHYNKTYKELYGLNKDQAEELSQAISSGDWSKVSKDNPGTAFIKGVTERIYNNYKQDWGEDSTINQEIMNQIARGTVAALGQDKLHVYEDYYNRYALQHSGDNKSLSGSGYNPLPLRSEKELSDNNKEIQKYIGKGYIKQNENGTYALTNKGLNHMYNMRRDNTGSGEYTKGVGAYESLGRAMSAANAGTSTTVTPHYKIEKTDFGKWFTNIYGEDLVDEKASHASGELKFKGYKGNKALNNYIDYNKEGSYDIYRSTEYNIDVEKDERDYVKEAILSNISDDKVQIVDFDATDGKGKWAKTDKISKQDLNNNYEVINVRPSKYGDTAIFREKTHTSKNGKEKGGVKTVRIIIPGTSINPTADAQTRQAFAYLESANDFLDQYDTIPEENRTNELLQTAQKAQNIKDQALSVIHSAPLNYWRQTSAKHIEK